MQTPFLNHYTNSFTRNYWDPRVALETTNKHWSQRHSHLHDHVASSQGGQRNARVKHHSDSSVLLEHSFQLARSTLILSKLLIFSFRTTLNECRSVQQSTRMWNDSHGEFISSTALGRSRAGQETRRRVTTPRFLGTYNTSWGKRSNILLMKSLTGEKKACLKRRISLGLQSFSISTSLLFHSLTR